MLKEAELADLDSTLLPALERHHLRLLAHSLRTLQAIARGRNGPIPDTATIETWARSQPSIADDPLFLKNFVDQLLRAADQLIRIAASRDLDRQPLALQLSDLRSWALQQADRRLSTQAFTEESPGPHPPRD